MKDKTPKQIAKTIAISAIENSAMSEVTSCVNFKILVEAVEAALNAERERAAKIIDDEIERLRSIKYPTAHAIGEIQDLVRIATAIRGGKD